MKKALFLGGFLCFGLIAHASQGRNERVSISSSQYNIPMELCNCWYPTDSPDKRIRIDLEITDNSLGINTTSIDDGKNCLTIEVWMNGTYFGAVTNCTTRI